MWYSVTDGSVSSSPNCEGGCGGINEGGGGGGREKFPHFQHIINHTRSVCIPRAPCVFARVRLLKRERWRERESARARARARARERERERESRQRGSAHAGRRETERERRKGMSLFA
jgi:hypothetical protein